MPISSAGIGSGLDVASLVQQLVSAERAPQESRLQAATGRINVTLSALGTFKGGLTQLQSAVEALKGDTGAFTRHTTQLSAEGYFSATAGAAASAGTYDIEVLSLARSHKLASPAYADGAASVVGNGTVLVEVGADSFTVTLSDGANTLADLRDAINTATDNPGVRATLLTEDAGTRLVLTATTAGSAGTLNVDAQADGGGSLFATAQVQAASDAQVRIDGFTHTSSGNLIANALEGVTLDLDKAEPGTVLQLQVEADRSAAREAIDNLVRAYNAVVAVVKKQAGFDPASQTGGPLMGDVAVRSSMQQLRSLFGGAHGSGEISMLAQLGITTQTDGTLSVDGSALDAALDSRRDEVAALFSGPDGLAGKLTTALDGVIGSDGRIEAQTDRLQQRLDGIDDQTAALDRRMAAVEARYRRQFTALDAMLGQLQSTSSYLTQQLANLPGAGGNSG